MCWKCDHPGSTRIHYLAYMQALIEHHGWAVQGVEHDLFICPGPTPWD